MNFHKKLYILIAVSTLVRLYIATQIELANDEVYYWTYALKLQWNYFDHPPLVAALILVTTCNLLFHNELVVRLGAIVSSAVCTWLIFKIGTAVSNIQAGWFAALLYTSSIYCSLIAGTFILPDSPQMIFWLWSILILLKISRLDAFKPKVDMLWYLFGATSGLCIMSKVHGVFLWVAVILYAIIMKRDWLKNWSVYISAMITLLIISPIIIWNFQNDFASYHFHINRIVFEGSGVQMKRFLKEFASVVLLNNPINFFLIYLNIWYIIKGTFPVKKQEVQLLLFCSFPIILVLLFISLFRETMAHWTGPAYSCLLILPAVQLASVPKNQGKAFTKILITCLIYVCVIAALQVLVINFFPGTLSAVKQGIKTGSGDVTTEIYGWKEAGMKVDSIYKSDVANGTMPFGAPIVITNWYPAANIDFYIAQQTKQETIGIGDVLNLHEYYWTNRFKKALKNGNSAYYIITSNLFTYKKLNELAKKFARVESPVIIPQYRNGAVFRELLIFRLRGYKRRCNN